MNAKASSKSARNLCVLFADVAGSTRLHEKLGDKEAQHAVERCINRMTRATEQCHGRVVKTLGDQVMAVFDSAEAGLDAAKSMQQRVADLPPVRGLKLAIRVGFHFGPASEEAGEVFGDAVDIASRMAGLARTGQILTTADTVNALPAPLRQATRGIDARLVKGEAEELPVSEVIWRESDDLAMKDASATAPPPAVARLTVRHGGDAITLEAGHGIFSLGRDAASDIIINDRRASRSHARIERRLDQFVLIDQSTNGTYVTFDGEAEFVLKREEIVLRSRGRISFGHAFNEGAEVVEFRVG